jgi:hypothetical protein
MAQIQIFIGAIFDLLLTPFSALSPQWLLWSFSTVVALGSLFIFKYSTKQETLHQARSRIQGYLLEMRLFKDTPRLMLSAQWGLLKENGRCLLIGLIPLLIMIPPILLLFPHMENRMAWQPLHPGEETIVGATLSEEASSHLMTAKLVPSEGISIVSPPLRIPSLHEICWKIKARTPGHHLLKILISGQSESLAVVVSNRPLEKIVSEKLISSWWNDLWTGGAPTLSSGSPLQKISITYPGREIPFLFWAWNWLVVFFIEVLLVGWILKYFLKVEI